MMMYGDTRIVNGHELEKVNVYENEIKKLGGRLEDKLKRTYNQAVQTKVYFPNGYGISFIEGGNSYGLEAAILKQKSNGKWSICYSTPLTDDVIPYMEDSEILPLIKKVAKL